MQFHLRVRRLTSCSLNLQEILSYKTGTRANVKNSCKINNLHTTVSIWGFDARRKTHCPDLELQEHTHDHPYCNACRTLFVPPSAQATNRWEIVTLDIVDVAQTLYACTEVAYRSS